MIPAGTGIKNYKNVKLYDSSDIDLDVKMNEVLEQRRQEKELEQQYTRVEEQSSDMEDSD